MATIVTMFSSVACKKVINETITVVRDCTGTYLRFDGKDYHVCNPEKISSFPGGTEVEATFIKIHDCTGPANDAPACYLLHQSEGWINVEKIK